MHSCAKVRAQATTGIQIRALAAPPQVQALMMLEQDEW